MRYDEWSRLPEGWEEDLIPEIRNLSQSGITAERMLRHAEKHIRNVNVWRLMQIRNVTLSMFESFVRVVSGMAKIEAAQSRPGKKPRVPVRLENMEQVILGIKEAGEKEEREEEPTGRRAFVEDVKAIRTRLDMETLFMKRQNPMAEPNIYIINELRNVGNYMYQFIYAARTFGGNFEAINKAIDRYSGTMVMPKGSPIMGGSLVRKTS